LRNTLRSLHNAGVIHNDLEARNLLMNDKGQTTIIDFSHARFSNNKDSMEVEMRLLTNIVREHNMAVKHLKAAKERVYDSFGFIRV
jgi:tRNA A-37 threonylcarbamoyl transferase component Bud32